MIGLYDLRGLFQPGWFYDCMILYNLLWLYCSNIPLIFFYYLRKFCISNRISKIPNGTQYIYIFFLSWHLTLIWLVTYWWCWSWTVKAGISNENTPCVHKYVYIYICLFSGSSDLHFSYELLVNIPANRALSQLSQSTWRK